MNYTDMTRKKICVEHGSGDERNKLNKMVADHLDSLKLSERARDVIAETDVHNYAECFGGIFTAEEFEEYVNEYFPYKCEKIFEEMYGDLKDFRPEDLEAGNGEVIKGALIIGNDECFDCDEFYQYALTDDKVYKAYYEIPEEARDDLSVIDYSKPYRIEDVTEQYED